VYAAREDCLDCAKILVEATADVMKAEGAPALSYGEPQGYKGLRELVAHKHRLFENLEVPLDDIIVANGSGHALSLAFSDCGIPARSLAGMCSQSRKE